MMVKSIVWPSNPEPTDVSIAASVAVAPAVPEPLTELIAVAGLIGGVVIGGTGVVDVGVPEVVDGGVPDVPLSDVVLLDVVLPLPESGPLRSTRNVSMRVEHPNEVSGPSVPSQ